MTTAEAEQIISQYYLGDIEGLESDLKIYVEQGLTSLVQLAQDLLDSDWDWTPEDAE